MTNRPATSRRVGYRLDWCAYVELVMDEHPEFTMRRAFEFVACRLSPPFDTYKAFTRFRENNSGEPSGGKVGERKREIWQHWQDSSEDGRSSETGTLSTEDLTGLMGLRVTDSPDHLGMTHVPRDHKTR